MPFLTFSPTFLVFCVALFCVALFCVALFCVAQFCVALFCVALFCVALFCVALFSSFSILSKFLKYNLHLFEKTITNIT